MLPMLLTLMKPPFGIKAGIAPLLVFLFFINKRKELYLYQDGFFLTDINEITIEFIIKHPSKFSFKFVDYNQAEKLIGGLHLPSLHS